MFGHCYQAEVDSLETEVKKLMLSSMVQSCGVWMCIYGHIMWWKNDQKIWNMLFQQLGTPSCLKQR